jgi:hypothetical protein
MLSRSLQPAPFATAMAGGFIGYLAAGRGERATLREQHRRREREFQAALRALLIENAPDRRAGAERFRGRSKLG